MGGPGGAGWGPGGGARRGRVGAGWAGGGGAGGLVWAARKGVRVCGVNNALQTAGDRKSWRKIGGGLEKIRMSWRKKTKMLDKINPIIQVNDVLMLS